MRFPLLALFLIACALPAQARLGETEAECRARYGEPSPIKLPGFLVFLKGKFGIVCDFGDVSAKEKQCVKIAIARPVSETSALSRPINENEVAILLKANGGGQVWKKLNDTNFLTKDKKRGAVLTEERQVLTIVLLEEIQRETKEKAEEDLEGF